MKFSIFVVLLLVSLACLGVEESSAGPSPCLIAGATIGGLAATLGAVCAASFWVPFMNVAVCGGAVAAASASPFFAVTTGVVATTAMQYAIVGGAGAAMAAACRRKREAIFADEDPWMRSRFSQFDTNDDGFLSLDDVEASRNINRQKRETELAAMNKFLAFPKWLDILDKNQDRKISPQEWNNGFRWNATDDSLAVNLFSFADANRDESISLTELIESGLPTGGLSESLDISKSAMTRMDQNGDSLVSLDEFKTSLRNSIKEMGLKLELQ